MNKTTENNTEINQCSSCSHCEKRSDLSNSDAYCSAFELIVDTSVGFKEQCNGWNGVPGGDA